MHVRMPVMNPILTRTRASSYTKPGRYVFLPQFGAATCCVFGARGKVRLHKASRCMYRRLTLDMVFVETAMPTASSSLGSYASPSSRATRPQRRIQGIGAFACDVVNRMALAMYFSSFLYLSGRLGGQQWSVDLPLGFDDDRWVDQPCLGGWTSRSPRVCLRGAHVVLFPFLRS